MDILVYCIKKKASGLNELEVCQHDLFPAP